MEYLENFEAVTCARTGTGKEFADIMIGRGYDVIAYECSCLVPEVHLRDKTSITFNGLKRNTPKSKQRKLKKLYIGE